MGGDFPIIHTPSMNIISMVKLRDQAYNITKFRTSVNKLEFGMDVGTVAMTVMEGDMMDILTSRKESHSTG